MNFDNLHDVYVSQLKDMYSAENQLVDALPKLAAAASTPKLKDAFQQHLDVTRTHFERVRGLLDGLGVNPGNTVCEGMEGLVREGDDAANQTGDAKARDAALILAAQKAEHYEIASYGGLHTYAHELGYDDAADTLQDILDDEYDADEKLNKIAMGGLLKKGVNVAAEE